MSDNLKRKLLKTLEAIWKVSIRKDVNTGCGRYINQAIVLLEEELGIYRDALGNKEER